MHSDTNVCSISYQHAWCWSVMTEVSVSGEHGFTRPSITHWVTSRKLGRLSHRSLFAEPLLAGSAVLDVLQHITQHRPLPPLLLAHSLRPLVHLGTWEGLHREVNDTRKDSETCAVELRLQQKIHINVWLLPWLIILSPKCQKKLQHDRHNAT